MEGDGGEIEGRILFWISYNTTLYTISDLEACVGIHMMFLRTQGVAI